MWKEELYFEMYDFGQNESKLIITKSEFAQRMVDLKWKPSLKPIEIVETKIIYRNFGSIKCMVEFENKVNQTQKVVKEVIFPVILQDINWRFNLIQLIRSPFVGKFYTPPPPKPKKQEEKKETAPAEQEEPAEGGNAQENQPAEANPQQAQQPAANQ